MKRDYYTTPRSNRLMRMFWKAAGADRYLLEKSTYSDQVKYMCLGGIIVATGVMAGIAGGYAFYTIFEPRGSALDHDFSLRTSLMSIVFGIIWGLMIYNIDRFIVSSTGKGDGTEAITWQEFKGAIPRILMGMIIAITISKPVEIRMFKSEIDVKLYEMQLKSEAEFKQKVNANYDDRIAIFDEQLAKVEAERTQLTDLMKEIALKLNDIGDRTVSRTTRRINKDGEEISIRRTVPDPTIQEYERRLASLQGQLDEFDSKNASKVESIETSKAAMFTDKEDELSKNKIVASGLDGLLERIILSHDVAGPWITLFITLLFMAIELTPIFFKLMLVKSPYDFLKENVEELIKAEAGIYTQPNYYKDKEGMERDLTIHTGARRLVNEAMELQKAQKRLTQYAVEKYEEAMKKKIDADPSAFIQGDSDSAKTDA